MNIEVVSFLKQMVATLKQAEAKLEEAYKKNDSEGLTVYKNFILEIQKKISESLIK
jgi:hypothetical protein